MESDKHEEMPKRVMLKALEGRMVSLGGIGVVFKLFAEDTGGSFSIIEHPIQPKTLVPPHSHENEDEFSIIVEGKIGARIGDNVIEATPGSYVLKPRRVPHTFWNAGDKLARLVEIISPAGFEKFFEEAAELFPATGLPDVQKIAAVANRYRVTLGWGEWIPQLTEKYKLKLFGR